MAMYQCPRCTYTFSENVYKCPHCGVTFDYTTQVSKLGPDKVREGEGVAVLFAVGLVSLAVAAVYARFMYPFEQIRYLMWLASPLVLIPAILLFWMACLIPAPRCAWRPPDFES